MNTTANHTSINTLVLGATGSIGYAVTANLIARGLPVTILVRSRAKAERLFPNAPTLTILEGDVQDKVLLSHIAAGRRPNAPTHIFHGINYPYHQWRGNMDRATQNVIEAAALTGATIVFPGNVYNFGKIGEPIREDSLPNPISQKGQVRVELEARLEQATRADRKGNSPVRVLNVRLPDFWGPNVLNAGVKPIFENALRGNALPWLLNADIPHQSVYTVDAAEVIVRLMLRGNQQPYDVWNYGGTMTPSIRSWFGQISALTGQPLNVTVYSRLAIRVLGLVNPVVREVNEMLYLYENTIRLDDTKLRTAFPDFHPTPMPQALTETLTWFAKHQLGQSFRPATTILVSTPA